MQVSDTGFTGYRNRTGRNYVNDMLPFGETVMAKKPDDQRKKLSIHWIKGLWVGRSNESDEHIVLSKEGADTYRTVKRFSQESDRWDRSVLDEVKGLPWDKKGITQQVSDGGMPGMRKMTKTPGCPGCEKGRTHHHTVKCQERRRRFALGLDPDTDAMERVPPGLGAEALGGTAPASTMVEEDTPGASSSGVMPAVVRQKSRDDAVMEEEKSSEGKTKT